MSSFASMRSAIRELRRGVDGLHPPIKPRFRPPANEEEVHTAERLLGLTFPADLRFFLLCHNGQHFYDSKSGYGDPIIPMMRQPPDGQGYSHYWLNGTEETIECTLAFRDAYQWFKDERFDTIGPAHYHDQFLLFTSTENADCLVLDLLPAPGGIVGQVVLLSTQAPHIIVLAPDLESYLRSLAADYMKGRFSHNRCEHYVSYLEP